MLMKWYKNRQSINIHLQKRHYYGHKSYGFCGNNARILDGKRVRFAT